jgi:hypothetical protein
MPNTTLARCLLIKMTDASQSSMHSVSVPSPRTGAAAAPVPLPRGSSGIAPRSPRIPSLLLGQLSSSSFNQGLSFAHPPSPRSPVARRRRSHSGEESMSSPGAPGRASRRSLTDASTALAKAQSRSARKLNDSMVYLDGPQVYTCAQCRTHLTSHDEIISKSFHGRHGEHYRAVWLGLLHSMVWLLSHFLSHSSPLAF